MAIATHTRNHPDARHYCVNLDAARPEELVPEGQLDLLMASPECTFFSRARGGKPVRDQWRVSAWHVQRWASTLDINALLIENVPEFRDWGPVDGEGKPDPAQKGLYFQAWVQALWGMGYTVDWRLLNAANFGDATTRVRFFLQARKDGRPIRWPEPSHSATGEADMLGQRPRWRSARDVIDWANPGNSLLNRKRPLSLKTRLRIARGLVRFGGELAPAYVRLLDLPAEEEARLLGLVEAGAPEPFVCGNRENNTPRAVDDPLPTATTATGGGMFLVQPSASPFVLGQQSGAVARSADAPLPTIATDGAISLVEPMLTSYYGASDGAQSVDSPVPTITTVARHGLCCPMVVPYGPKAEARSTEDPLPTIMTRDRLGVCGPTARPFVFGKQSSPSYRMVTEPLPTITTMGAPWLVSPFIVPQFGEAEGQSPRVHDIADPLPAVTSHGAGALVDPVIVHIDHSNGWGSGVRSIDEPLSTIVTEKNLAVAEPVVLQMAQVGRTDEGMARSVDQPLYTITTHNNLAVAEPVLTRVAGELAADPRRLVMLDGAPCLLDIRFRMLTNRELARAMSFDDATAEYQFTGNAGEVTRQIGNAVPVRTAEALVTAILVEAGS